MMLVLVYSLLTAIVVMKLTIYFAFNSRSVWAAALHQWSDGSMSRFAQRSASFDSLVLSLYKI
jgi:hypothetical protein